MIVVKVLGSGCANCKRLETETRAALDEAGIQYELVKVTDFDEIAGYGVMRTPALVVNETVVSSGKILARQRILELVREAGALSI